MCKYCLIKQLGKGMCTYTQYIHISPDPLSHHFSLLNIYNYLAHFIFSLIVSY